MKATHISNHKQPGTLHKHGGVFDKPNHRLVDYPMSYSVHYCPLPYKEIDKYYVNNTCKELNLVQIHEMFINISRKVMGHSKCGEISKTTVFNKTMKLNWNFHPG